ncbi:MAG: site-specific integrase [Bacteroidales bacterium]|jgi:integrase|nr:site-specific integrase [Bacteroidales bacterium]
MQNQKTISELIDLWKADKKQYVKKSSYAAYILLIENHVLPAFGAKYSVENADVQSFVLHKLAQGLSRKTVKDIVIVLKMILKFGAKIKMCTYTPFDIQYPTEHETHNIEVLSRANQKKIMDYVKTNFTFKNLGVYICLCTGMRIGEICALTWGDIDTENGIIAVHKTIQRIYVIENGSRRTELLLDTPKTKNSIREIPLTNNVIKLIKPFKKVVNDTFFVLTNELKPTEPRIYRNYYDNLLKTLKIPKLKFHGLRHSFATRCIESNCDYKTVSVLLGHANIATTLNLYVHPNFEQKKKCVEQMAKTLR